MTPSRIERTASPPRTLATVAVTNLIVLLAAGCAAPNRTPENAPAGEPPSAEERVALWRSGRPGEPLPAAVTLARPIGFDEAREFLERHGLRPYAVHVHLAGLGGAPRMEMQDASIELLDRAREQVVDLLLRTLCDSTALRARLGASQSPRAGATDDDLFLRAMLTRLELSRSSLSASRDDPPIIHGLKVIGEPEAIEALGADPAVAWVEPGMRMTVEGVQRVIVPDPVGPVEQSGPERIDWIEALPATEVRARLERAMVERPTECRVWSERQEELRLEGGRDRR